VRPDIGAEPGLKTIGQLFVWFSDDRGLKVVLWFSVLILVLVLIIVWVSRRGRVAHRGEDAPFDQPGGNVSLVYAAVDAGHLRVLEETGANAIIVWLSLLTCLVVFAILSVYTYQQRPVAIAALVIIAAESFAAGRSTAAGPGA